MKKKWIKPELIVVARYKPEESVLLGCKFFMPSGPGEVNGWCLLPVTYIECEEIVLS